MRRPRLYHSSAVLLPDCRVMVAGSDVTWDTTAEVYSPPYLGRGPRPVIQQLAPAMRPGVNLTVQYRSEDPVLRAILIRTTSMTHSVAFGEGGAGARCGRVSGFSKMQAGLGAKLCLHPSAATATL
jgi:hypothetical protein